MIRTSIADVVVAVVAVAACGSSEQGPLCDPAAVESALRGARPGESVHLGACRVVASLRVPAGVKLVGSQAGATRLAPPSQDAVTVTLVGGASDAPTELRDLTIEASGRIGVLATGPGEVSVTAVGVEAQRGAGLVAEDLDRLSVSDVHLTGPVTGDNQDSAELAEVTPEETATHGVLIRRVTIAELADLRVEGFASFGVAIDRTATVRWERGGAAGNLGVGVFLSSSNVDLVGVTVERTYRGLRGQPSYAVVAVDGTNLSTTGLALIDNAQYGIVHRGVAARHEGLTATNNGDAALWAGETASFLLDGCTFDRNAFAGIVVVDSSNVTLRDVEVARTRRRTTNVGLAFARVEVGDGVHLVDSVEGVTLQRVRLVDNERAGLLVDLVDGLGDGLTFEGVTVSGTGDQLGAVAGTVVDPAARFELRTVPPGGWDDGIARDEVTRANDQAQSGLLDVAGVGSPAALPTGDDATGIVTPCD